MNIIDNNIIVNNINLGAAVLRQLCVRCSLAL